ncbi:MAG: Membrane protein [Candidatus Jettenia ecosi]|uniref:Membrane protein n=1 Tax=Candidatus Jettenia ecosi TaxID=2494326 RepID=A0A533Q965_9BACT|nr:MAG: Membrane protein [Candidatus Jettenia ecosi]
MVTSFLSESKRFAAVLKREERLKNLIVSIKNKLQDNKGEIIYLGAQYSTPVVGFLVNILVMRYVDPETFGLYQSILLWGSYLSFLQMGVFNGLNRNLSYYKGAGRIHELQTAASTGFVFSILVSFIALLIVACISFSPINDHSQVAIWAFLLLCLTAFTQPMIIFFDTLYRTGQDFKKLGKFIAIDNSIYSANSLLIVFFGYIGFVIQAAIKVIVALSLRACGKISFVNFKFSFQSFTDQISTGFPILLNSYLYTTFLIFDQFYIVRTFDRVELGYYNLTRLVLLVIPIIPDSLTTVFYPKASAAYGKSGNQRNVLKPFFFKALEVNAIVLIPIILIVYFTIEPLVTNFLPKYVNGIEYAKISVIGGLGYIFVGPSVILGVLKKNSFNLIFLALLSFLTYGLYFLGMLTFSDIESLIWFKNILFVSYGFLMLVFVYSLITIKD